MESKAMNGAELIDEATGTGSLSTAEISISSVLDTSSTMDTQQAYESVDGDISALHEDQLHPTIEETAPEEEEIEAVVKTTPTLNRIPYDNGYGDFFFGHINRWERKPIREDMSEEEKQDIMGIAGSNGVPVVELNNFQRSGPFQYSQLPIEIRHKILRILLEPVFSTYHNGHTEVEYTSFKIASLPDPCDDDNLNCGSEDLYAESERRANRRYKAMCYPGRKYLYLLTLHPVRTKYHNGPSKDWVFLEWIRQASHVSTSFRHELGQVLWANTVIFAKGEEDNHYTIEYFLKERPWVLQGIKGLGINLKIEKGEDINERGFFDGWCDYIAKSLNLTSAWFNIHISERDLKQFVEGNESGLDGLAATSKLRVSQYFDVTLERVYDDSDDYYNDVEDWDEQLEEYQAVVLEHMMPFSLRSQTPETEEQRYLQTRAGSTGEPASDTDP